MADRRYCYCCHCKMPPGSPSWCRLCQIAATLSHTLSTYTQRDAHDPILREERQKRLAMYRERARCKLPLFGD